MRATCTKPASPLAENAFSPNQSGKLGVRLSGVFAKLGARDRVDAVNRAVARGLVPPRA